MRLTPLQARIVSALSATTTRRMSYYALAEHLWPIETHPRAWRYSTNGGPHAWAMPLGQALRVLRAAGVAYESNVPGGGAGPGDVVLMAPNDGVNGPSRLAGEGPR